MSDFYFLGLHIELGDCTSYYHDMIILRDIFNSRQEYSNELYCYSHQTGKRFHWSQVPELNYNYVMPRRTPPKLIAAAELYETCFDQFTKSMFLYCKKRVFV